MAKLPQTRSKAKASEASRSGGTRAKAKPSGKSAPAKAGRRSTSNEIELEGVRLSSPEKVLWEEQGLTKRQLAEYYLDIADWVLPHVVGRPLSLVRCPSGAEKGCFFQKHPWAGLDANIARGTVATDTGEQEVVLVRDIRGVIGLVQAGVLEIHPWGATMAEIDRPDRVVFDFDPGEGVPWSQVVASACELRHRLEALGLESFLKTTGGKGLHVVVPLAPQAGWPKVKAFARNLAEAMEADSPDRYLTKAAKAEREGRVFIDYLRNARGATAIAAYSPRARAGAPVSTPLAWDEIRGATASDQYTVETVPARLRALGEDPWRGFDKLRQMLPE